jgi:hypothetical protein
MEDDAVGREFLAEADEVRHLAEIERLDDEEQF